MGFLDPGPEICCFSIGFIIFIIILWAIVKALSRPKYIPPSPVQHAPPPQQPVQHHHYHNAPQQPQQVVKEREVTREIVKIRCQYCGNLYEERIDKCPSCGGR